MPVTFPLLIPVLLSVLAGVAIYLVLPHDGSADLRRWKLGGVALLSAVLLISAILTGRSAPWWPAAGRSLWPLVGHDLLAVIGVGSAVLIVASSRPILALAGGVMLLLSGGALCCLHGAVLTGSALLVSAGVLLVVAWRYRTRLLRDVRTVSGIGTGPEPFLACLATAVLTGLLIGGVDYSLHAPRIQDRDGLRGAIERVRQRRGFGPDGAPISTADATAPIDAGAAATTFVPEALGLTVVLLAVMAGGILVVYRSGDSSRVEAAVDSDMTEADSTPTSSRRADSHV